MRLLQLYRDLMSSNGLLGAECSRVTLCRLLNPVIVYLAVCLMDLCQYLSARSARSRSNEPVSANIATTFGVVRITYCRYAQYKYIVLF